MTTPSQEYTCDVTVNIMSYQYGHLVCQAIESVLNQTAKPKIIRVFDDGVGDCFFVSEKYPEVELVERDKNLGIIKNFNDALRRTDTKYVMFLGADNWLHPSTLECLMMEWKDLTAYDAYMIGPWSMDKVAQYRESGYTVWKTNGTPHGSSLYSVQLAKKVGGYKASGNKHTEEDSVLFNKMIKAGASVGYVERPLLYYRKHAWNYNK